MLSVTISLTAIFMAIILHEIAHGYVAYLLGDPTAKNQGRLSPNPLKHIDPIGTVVVPLALFFSNAGFIFGWAKPVPINYYNLKNFKRDIVLVSSAGIVTNLALAFISALILKNIGISQELLHTSIIASFLASFMLYNIVLAVFNLLPIPPLDGSKMLFAWIDKPWAQKYLSNDKYGFIIIIAIGFIIPTIFSQFNMNFDILGIYISEFTMLIINALL